MQRYNTSAGNYDPNYAASQYVQSYYGNAASTMGTYPMTPLGASFLYPHLYSAGHHTPGGIGHHQGQEGGLVDEYATSAAPTGTESVVPQRGSEGVQTDPNQQQHTAYSQLGGEDESQTGPIRGGYLKSEHGVWRPY